MCTDAYRQALTEAFSATAPSAPLSAPAPSEREAIVQDTTVVSDADIDDWSAAPRAARA